MGIKATKSPNRATQKRSNCLSAEMAIHKHAPSNGKAMEKNQSTAKWKSSSINAWRGQIEFKLKKYKSNFNEKMKNKIWIQIPIQQQFQINV